MDPLEDKFKGNYRIACARWAAWDCGHNAADFVTICTQERAHHFGQIANRAMNLSPLGQVAADCWSQIPDHFPFVRLGAFVVMPNHVHGISVIDQPVQTQNLASLRRPLRASLR